MPAPEISLVVSSIGRPSELRRLVDSLRSELEAGPTVELIVVDQSDDGRCFDVLQELDTESGPAISWAYLTSPIGVSRGRNLGMAVARGELIMFPDDDAWFNGDTLIRAATHLHDNPEHDGLCTQLQDGEGAPSMLRWAPSARTVTKHNHHRTSIGSTMLFRTEVARAVGEFDESLGPGAAGWYGSCEDADFLLRVIEQGGHVWYDPDVVMNHRDSRRDGGPLAQAKALGYGCGQGHMWRHHGFPRWLILSLAVRRLIGGVLWSLRDRPDIGRAHRAWVRGSINGWLGRPPADLETGPVDSSAGSDPPTSAEFGRSLSWRLLVAPIGTVATFTLTAIAARTLSPGDVTIFYALLAALMIGPILGRFGLNQWAVKDLASLRTREDIAAAVALGRRYVISVVGPASVAAPLISVLFISGISHGRLDLGLVVLATVILFAETWRLSVGDVLLGLGQTGWAAALAHQVRAAAVTLAVLVHMVVAPDQLGLERIMALMAIVTVVLVVGGLYRLWTLPSLPDGPGLELELPRLLRRGYPFLVVDLIVVVVARGDVWLAGPTLAEDTAARYGTASVLAAQIGVPIGLASVALAPVVAGLVAQRKLDAVEQVVRSLATVVAYALVPVLIVFVFFGRSLLELAYGPPYGDALPYLLVLMIGNVTLALLGAGPVVLLMSGRQRETMVVGGCWFAVAATGAVGAAVVGGAMALALASAMTTVGLYVLLAFTTWAVTGVRLLPYLDPRDIRARHSAPLTEVRDAMLVASGGERGVAR